ncbi:MAG TPA: hypothetical protein VG456_06160 [Candidatus Sulfopaludibacter sp.]|jgi:hypothetical protein|nr:hypothetical protein [Candidatus Sulfopaludibacter sp.]
MNCATTMVITLAAASALWAQQPAAINEAKSLLREAGSLVPQIEEGQQTSAAVNISGQQARAGDLAGALATVRAVQNPLSGGMAYSAVALQLTADGHWDTAMELLAALPEGAHRGVAYFAIGSQLASKRDFVNARAVAAVLRQDADAVPCYGDLLLDIGAREGSLDAVREALDSMETIDAARGQSMLQKLSAVGMTEGAALVAARLQIAEMPESRRVQPLAQVAMLQAQRRDAGAAVTLSQAEEEARVSGAEASDWEAMAVTRGLLSDIPGAVTAVNNLDAQSRPWPLWNLTGLMVHAGQKAAALSLARGQESPHAQVYGLLGVAAALMDR